MKFVSAPKLLERVAKLNFCIGLISEIDHAILTRLLIFAILYAGAGGIWRLRF